MRTSTDEPKRSLHPLVTQEPHHLREDFCGTALVAATWCRGDVFRSALGLDLDPEPLRWGAENNAALLGGGAPSQLCLLQCNVRWLPGALHPAGLNCTGIQ